ncbi:MAG TPA: mechanosensitive ion channel domain-containing protein [Microthrixaceae bacterium]|nr:mechanosensitive ion channel domain-containing protein [Microthrixaceae bacterium]
MDATQFILAGTALGCGLLFGELAGKITRSSLEHSTRHPRLAERGAMLGNFVFWAATAAGLVMAIAILDLDTLRHFEEQLVDDLPRFLLSFVWLIVGYAAAVAISATVGQSARKATGIRQPGLERALQVTIMVAALAAAMSQAGIGSDILVLLVGVAIGAPSIAMALLSGLGGREVAAELAAGRALRHHLRPGSSLTVGDVTGLIIAVHTTTVEVETKDGAKFHVPNRKLLGEGFSVS